uniref:hypothetical protein n=1 Tax=Agathobacter sp. TaxID=2021311 RepID=UPI004056234E
MKIRGLCEKNVIYFDSIGYGLRNYENEIIKMDETEAYSFFSQKVQAYGTENAFADFYFFTLDEEAKEKIIQILDEEEIAYLEEMRPLQTETQLVFFLEDTLLRMIVKLNAREMLFSTIYFQGVDALVPETYWGNYKQEYVRFHL